MNILFTILDLVRETLIWAWSLVLDREPHGGEALRLQLLLLFTGFATWLTFFWRGLLLRWRFMRKRFLPGERFAGQYVQAVKRGEAIRYAILRIAYNGSEGRYEAEGRNYNSSGEEVSSFWSNHVFLPGKEGGEIEFIWEGSRVATGYTTMTAEISEDGYAEGEGYLVTFGQPPKSFPLLFKQLDSEGLHEALGIGAPARPKEEPEFIRKFHKEFGEDVVHGFATEAEEVS
jgi:hypothetical protein